MQFLPSIFDDRGRPAAMARRGAMVLLAVAGACLGGARAQDGHNGNAAVIQADDGALLEGRDALRKRDRSRLAAARAVALAGRHPLAMWVDYWELSSRLPEAQHEELEAFYARWPGTYVEDRLRNDWLLELGRRGDWKNFAADFPRFRMNDDREVTCYAALVDQLAGKAAAAEARDAWFAQREPDNGCVQLGAALFAAKVLTPADVWRKSRIAVDSGRPRVAQQALELLGPGPQQAGSELLDSPVRYMTRRAAADDRNAAELTALALLRLAQNDVEAATRLLNDRWDRALPADLAAWVWGSLGRQSAQRLSPDAPALFQTAQQRLATRPRSAETPELEWSDETLAWKARAALRASAGTGEGITLGAGRWLQALQAIDAMSPPAQRDAAWIYWKARALQALAAGSSDPAAQRAQAVELLRSIAGQLHFYGQLAAEDLGQPLALPPSPAPLTPQERQAAAAHPGLARALQLIALGLRSEGVREWNFSLRGMGDRELLAAAQRACEREVWDRCINTSDRTRDEVDMAQRFPTPYRAELLARAKEISLDPAYVYGLIRQESRFVSDARSGVGAAGLMQIMPATARWTAKKTGLAYRAEMITDRDVNLRLGTSYLKLVLDDFGGSQAMAAAAYNAGPGRPRRWREGPRLEVAAWAENIPFAETRDYVKKVLSNAAFYAALLNGQPLALKPRLGPLIGPRESFAPAPNVELP